MAAASLLFSPSSYALPIARIFWVICGSATATFCSAKVGKAKLIASPTRAISKRVFIVSSDRFRMIVAYRPASGFLVSRDVHVAGTEKTLAKVSGRRTKERPVLLGVNERLPSRQPS